MAYQVYHVFRQCYYFYSPKECVKFQFVLHREQIPSPLETLISYLYCCTVHLVDSLNITLPTNALIVCHLF